MIHSFADNKARAIFNSEVPNNFPQDILGTAKRRLTELAAAVSLMDLAHVRGYRLERLKGDLKDFWSIRVNQQWRIVFRWDNGAHDVKIMDYHA